MNIPWKLIVMKYLKVLLSAFLAGVMISLGVLAYIGIASMGYPICGAFVASFGLVMTCLYGYNLFTSKLAFALENNALYILEIVLSWIGNLIGTLLVGIIVKGTRLMEDGNNFKILLTSIAEEKMGDGVLSVLLMSLLCGVVIYLAVNTYKKAEQPIARFGSVVFAIVLITLVGLEETTMDMFIMFAYKPFDGDFMTKIVYITIGNIVGVLTIPLLNKLRGIMKSV